jgi:hypothetical protein
MVCKKNPVEVGHPPGSAMYRSQPNVFCVIWNVSGFAMRKKISVA